MNFDEFENELRTCADCRVRMNIPASDMTTFRIGGPIRYVAVPACREALVNLVRLCRKYRIPYRVIGCGSNLLARDEGYDGVWILTEECTSIIPFGNRLEIDAGSALDELIDYAAKLELAGIENLAGIPGSVGGAVYMNAGAFGTQLSDAIVAVDVYDPIRDERYSIPYEACKFSYRKSLFQSTEHVILGASLRLGHSRGDIVSAHAERIREKRRQTQPAEYPNAGSIFRRPRGYFAGRLIEEAGFSGYRVGGACVSAQHAGFIVNTDHATGNDVKTMIREIKKRVFETFGVILQTEIIIE